MNKNRSRRDAGTAMWLALVLLMITSIGATATWRHMHHTMAYQKAVEKQEQCRNLAEAGLEKAVACLRIHADYRGESGTALGKGTFTVTVEAREPGLYLLASTGTMMSGKKYQETMCARLRLREDGVVHSYNLIEENAQ